MKSQELHSMANKYRFSDQLKSYELRLQAQIIQKEIGEIEKDRQRIGSAEDSIVRIKDAITKLKNEQ